MDEDPEGDRSDDGVPGIKDRDDDLDGLVDEDRDEQPFLLSGGGRNRLFNDDYILDDDEDGRIDEDRLDVSPLGGGVYPEGLGIDNDGDSVGIEDESSKININLAGNLSLDPQFSYHQGLGTWELDLGMALAARMIPSANLVSVGVLQRFQDLAAEIVLRRYGEDEQPGVAGKDDQNTNGDFFVHITKTRMEQEGRSYTLFSGVVGNGLDEARQSPTQTASEDWSASSLQFCDDETEIFFGFPRQPNQEFWSVTRPWGKSSIQRNIYLPGDGLDNDGDGDIDEPGEEVDDPTESGLGDDQPWEMLDDFREFILSNPAGVSSLLMSGKTLDDVYEALKPIVTVRSRSPIYGPAFFSEDNDTLSRRFLAPNMLNPYTPLKLFLDSVQDKRQTSIATTLENPDSPQPKLEPLAFPNNIRYLYP